MDTSQVKAKDTAAVWFDLSSILHLGFLFLVQFPSVPPSLMQTVVKPVVAQLPASLEPLIKAKPISQPVAFYPESAKLAGQEGRVLVKAYIDIEGNVTETEVLRSTGFRELDQAAEETVMKMKFEPAHRGNIPEESDVVIPIQFSLR